MAFGLRGSSPETVIQAEAVRIQGDAFIASGDEVGFAQAEVLGTLRINGALYTESLIVPMGGIVIFGSTGTCTTGAFQ